MYFHDTVELIAVEASTDKDGYPISAETATEVYADVASVTRSEFYAGKQAGVELALRVTIMACDYGGQRLLDYDGKRYRVERAYNKNGERLELNCSENKGAVL